MPLPFCGEIPRLFIFFYVSRDNDFISGRTQSPQEAEKIGHTRKQDYTETQKVRSVTITERTTQGDLP